MAVTYSATVLQFYRSKVANSLLSVASAATEVLTLVHRLGVCPDEIRFQLRSIATMPSCFVVPPTIASHNASQSILGFGNALQYGGASGYYDIIAESTHPLVS